MAAIGEKAPRRVVTPAAWSRRPSLTVLAALAAVAVLTTVGSQIAPAVPEWVGHGLSHLFVGLPLGLLVMAAVRTWPPPRLARPGRLGRLLVVGGLGGVVLGQLLEVAGARVDEPGAAAIEAAAHTAGQIFTMLSMPMLLVGVLLSIIAAAREGAVRWWVVGAVALTAAVGFAVAFIGVPNGGG